jgi:hypothetical protein
VNYFLRDDISFEPHKYYTSIGLGKLFKENVRDGGGASVRERGQVGERGRGKECKEEGGRCKGGQAREESAKGSHRIDDQ